MVRPGHCQADHHSICRRHSMEMAHNLLSCYQFHEINEAVLLVVSVHLPPSLNSHFQCCPWSQSCHCHHKEKHELLFGSMERICFRYETCRPFTCGILSLVTQPPVGGAKVLGNTRLQISLDVCQTKLSSELHPMHILCSSLIAFTCSCPTGLQHYHP